MQDYDFHTLSPSDFELLTRDLLEAEYGWVLEAFAHGRDGGVDLRGYHENGKMVIQCKHYVGSTFAHLIAAAHTEVAKMDVEKPDRYLFVCSMGLTRTQKDSLAVQLVPWLVSSLDLVTRHDLNASLPRNPDVERQHFKLWLASSTVLERIANSGLWERSEALMEDICDRVRLYVRTASYETARARLDDRHVAILTGPPGVGKSMLAEMLLLAHWHEGWRVISVSSNIDEAWTAFKKDENQIFYYDDFLGQTDISERSFKNEDNRILRFLDRVSADPTKRLIMTTRSQILRQAETFGEALGRANFRVRETVVKLSEYGAEQRAKVLYNHLYFSYIPRAAIREYVEGGQYWEVINHPNFSPRTIEQTLNVVALVGGSISERLKSNLDRPVNLWGTMFMTVLTPIAKKIVLTLVSFPVHGVDQETLRLATGGDRLPLEYTQALKALEGTYIELEGSPLRVSYADPSVRDFVLATLDMEPHLVVGLLENAVKIDQLRLLLEYAEARSGGTFRFPSMRLALTDRYVDYVRLVEHLAKQGLEAAKNIKSRGSFTRQNVVVPLASVLRVARPSLPR